MRRHWITGISILVVIGGLGSWVVWPLLQRDESLPQEQLVQSPPRAVLPLDGPVSKMLLDASNIPGGIMALDFDGHLPITKTRSVRDCYETEALGRTGFAETVWQARDETIYESISAFDKTAEANASVGAQRLADQCLVDAINREPPTTAGAILAFASTMDCWTVRE